MQKETHPISGKRYTVSDKAVAFIVVKERQKAASISGGGFSFLPLWQAKEAVLNTRLIQVYQVLRMEVQDSGGWYGPDRTPLLPYLSKKLGVSYATIRRRMIELDRLGWVKTGKDGLDRRWYRIVSQYRVGGKTRLGVKTDQEFWLKDKDEIKTYCFGVVQTAILRRQYHKRKYSRQWSHRDKAWMKELSEPMASDKFRIRSKSVGDLAVRYSSKAMDLSLGSVARLQRKAQEMGWMQYRLVLSRQLLKDWKAVEYAVKVAFWSGEEEWHTKRYKRVKEGYRLIEGTIASSNISLVSKRYLK